MMYKIAKRKGLFRVVDSWTRAIVLDDYKMPIDGGGFDDRDTAVLLFGDDSLTNKQKRFVEEYLIDLNGTQAAIRAGHSVDSARQIATENLSKPAIAEQIFKALEARSNKVKIDAQYVLNRLGEIDQMDVSDILDSDGSTLPLLEWPKVWRTYLSAIEVAELIDGANVIGVLKKIKWPSKLSNLELLGKHTNVSAFKERMEHTGPNGGPIEIKSTLSHDQALALLKKNELAP